MASKVRQTQLHRIQSADAIIRKKADFASILPAGAGVQNRVIAVVQQWARMAAPPDIQKVLEGLWVLSGQVGAFYDSNANDFTGADLLVQAMNTEFIALNLQRVDLNPQGAIKTVDDLAADA
ncbi:hypothetical protein FTO74_10710 [Granulicella sp. WH15]|uniref:hypothetical protein n=1 Tax=Granulicella sp. WH15 TaxID=2602070 RepID=UPI00136685B0|nr:hypothetical protein [Granulicella sp. WH15]QHN03792.1 hypothetical protein FTO74_10710 [Granulicella sp. WH15]